MHCGAGGEERREARDGSKATYSQLLAHYGTVRGKERWDAAAAYHEAPQSDHDQVGAASPDPVQVGAAPPDRDHLGAAQPDHDHLGAAQPDYLPCVLSKTQLRTFLPIAIGEAFTECMRLREWCLAQEPVVHSLLDHLDFQMAKLAQRLAQTVAG